MNSFLATIKNMKHSTAATITRVICCAFSVWLVALRHSSKHNTSIRLNQRTVTALN